MSTDVRFFVGIDWASETHQVCLVAADGKIVGERAFAHGGAGLAEMCDWLVTTSGEEPPKMALSRCHAKSASGPGLTDFQAAATASRHVVIAAARSTR